MGAVAYGVNLKPMLDVEAALAGCQQAKALKDLAAKKLAVVENKILDFETRTDMAAPMGLQREYTFAVKEFNKANVGVARAESALRTARAKAKKN
jgi:hypothetical protein